MAKTGKAKKSEIATSVGDERIVALLDRIAGDGKGAAILARLREEPAERVADDLARSAAFGGLYKRVRTGDVGVDGAKAADPGLVGLPGLPRDLTFEQQYRRFFRPRLGKRAAGFDAIFKEVLALGRSLFIVETGTLRQPGNWEGDGQSTFMFDSLTRSCGGAFFSIDVTIESIESARRACSSSTQLIANDSVAALHALAGLVSKRIDILYLDSFDVDAKNPLPSAIHHGLELTAVRPLIGPGTLVCVDDYAIGPGGGKGMIVERFLDNIGAEIVYAGYQKIWRMV